MVTIKREKVERACNFSRVMHEVTLLGGFVRLVDYLVVEGVVDRTITTCEELLALLQGARQACPPPPATLDDSAR
jgi:dynein heavy chain, axonemal